MLETFSRISFLVDGGYKDLYINAVQDISTVSIPTDNLNNYIK